MIVIRCTQYTGPIPGGTASGSYGYALMALRLEEFNVTPSPVTLAKQPVSQTVLELSPVQFLVGARGNPPPTVQWYRNEQAIPGATNAILALPEALLADDGAQFKVVARNEVSNQVYTATSGVATLRVLADTTPPVPLSVMARGLSQVQVAFSKPVEPDTANDAGHYSIAQGAKALTIQGAALDTTGTNVLLSVETMIEDAVYTLRISGVTDRTAAKNPVPGTNALAFAAVSYQPHSVGDLTPAGTLTPNAGGYDVTAGGADIGGASDQFFFSSLPQSGDFDLQVRLEGLESADPWAKAGLIARQSTQADSAFVAVLATPGAVGVFLESRAFSGGDASATGSHPVNYPNTWLRLQRVGNQFTGYASADGRTWVAVASTTVALSSTLEVGFAVCGHGDLATARFRDLAPGSGAVAVRRVASVSESLGQSSRASPWVFSEVLYDPVADGTNRSEFVEIYNSLGTPQDLGGYRLSGDIDFTFPAPTVVSGNGFVVVARDPERVRAVAGGAAVLGPYQGGLSKNGGRVRLRHRAGALFLEVDYGTRTPWPVAANGLGHSLALARPSYGEDDPRAWAASDRIGGSPGRAESVSAEPMRGIVINEFLVRPAEGAQGFVELHNPTGAAVDVGGGWLSADRENWSAGSVAAGYLLPAKTVIPAGGFLVVGESQLGAALDPAGGTIFLVNSNRARVIDALRYEGQGWGVARGRFPNGAAEVYALQAPTPGAANPQPRVGDVVINELMCDPVSDDAEDQFVELHNRGAGAVDVSGWTFTRGIDFPDSPRRLDPRGRLPRGGQERRPDARAQPGPAGRAEHGGRLLGHAGEAGRTRGALRARDRVEHQSPRGDHHQHAVGGDGRGELRHRRPRGSVGGRRGEQPGSQRSALAAAPRAGLGGQRRNGEGRVDDREL